MGLQKRIALTISALVAAAVLLTAMALTWAFEQSASADINGTHMTMTLGDVRGQPSATGLPSSLTFSTEQMLTAMRQRVQGYAVVVALGMLLAGLGASFLLARHITKPVLDLTSAVVAVEANLDSLVRATSAVAHGDLTADVAIDVRRIDVRSTDEIGDLAVVANEMIAKLEQAGESFEEMVASLRILVGQVGGHAATVNSAAVQLALAADQAEHATSQIAAATQQVARGAGEQSDGVVHTATSLSDLFLAIDEVARGAQDQAVAVSTSVQMADRITASITQVAAHAQASSETAVKSAEVARSGTGIVEESIGGMNQIAAKVETSAQKVREMGASSRKIGDIATLIEDIAERTALLAINASIEAAHAGQHGKGFAVVAEAIQNLAQRASASTRDVSTLVKGINQTVVQAMSATDEAQQEVAAGVTRANELRSALGSTLDAAEVAARRAEEISIAAHEMSSSSGELLEAMQVVSDIVDQNRTAADRMAAASTDVQQSVDHIASVSVDNSASAEEVSAAAEEVNAQAQGVADLAQSLTQMARSLHDGVSQFNVQHGDLGDADEDDPSTRWPETDDSRDMAAAFA